TGIWKPVSWVLANPVEIDDVSVQTVAINADGSAELEALVELRHNHGTPCAVDCELTVAGQTRRLVIDSDPSNGRAVARFTVANAKLWWPHNHGAQPLYDWSATLSRAGKALDSRKGRFGIRTVRLIQEPDSDGGVSFVFAINGKKIFMKGMNWTPADGMFCRVDQPRYDQLLNAAKD